MISVSRIRKWSVGFAALGWLWLSVGGAFHFHQDSSASNTTENCAVCHTLPQLKTAKTASSFQVFLPCLHASKLEIRVGKPHSVSSVLDTRSRSPPSV